MYACATATCGLPAAAQVPTSPPGVVGVMGSAVCRHIVRSYVYVEVYSGGPKLGTFS